MKIRISTQVGSGCDAEVDVDCRSRSSRNAAGRLRLTGPVPGRVAEKKEDPGTPSWDLTWDRIVEQALPADLLSASVARAVNEPDKLLVHAATRNGKLSGLS